jgi:mono/diheme cytochrome c family protein
MRVFAIISILVLLALALFLAAHFGSPLLFPAQADHGKAPLQGRRAPANAAEAPHERTRTNGATGPQEGFYVGKGDQRVYVDYATRDPVLRSLIQSAMETSSDPNAKGKELYLKICAACHQRDGEGKEGVAPPLAGSEWALAPGGGRLVRIVLNGLTGPIRVNGRDWNLPMPPWRANLDDDEVAVVLTYVRSQLGSNRAGPVTPESVAAVRKEVRATPETSDDLLRISDQ